MSSLTQFSGDLGEAWYAVQAKETTMPSTPQEVLDLIREKEIQIVDLKFVDLPGTWQHCSFYYDQIDESAFSTGLAFDGSSIRGWKAINESDMLMAADPTTAWIDPFAKVPTLSLTCSIKEPRTGQPYARDPRSIAAKAVDYLKASGIADTAFFGPEAEFFIFDDVRFDQTQNSGYYFVDSVEGRWNSGREEAGWQLGL